jgi:hypothetical protein
VAICAEVQELAKGLISLQNGLPPVKLFVSMKSTGPL